MQDSTSYAKVKLLMVVTFTLSRNISMHTTPRITEHIFSQATTIKEAIKLLREGGATDSHTEKRKHQKE